MQKELRLENEALPTDFVKPDQQETVLGFSEKLHCLEDVVTRHPLNREILYSVLAYCKVERPLTEIEAFIETLPQFKSATQNQYRMIKTLENAYGLSSVEYDEAGEIIDAAIKAALSEDEIDDLVASYSYQTTEVGTHFVEQHKPKARIIELLDLVPERAETYKELLAFINESPRTYDEICQLLKGRPALEKIVDGNRVTMQPSVFLDMLERSGALVWDGKWVLTREGGEFLDELKVDISAGE